MDHAVRKYVETVGDAHHQGFTITHGLDTKDVVVSVYDARTGEDMGQRVNITVLSLGEVLIDTSFQIFYDPEQARIHFGPGWTPNTNQLKVLVCG